MFKPILENNFEIAQYINELSTNYIDIEVVEEYFFGCFAILKEVDFELIKVDNEGHHLQSKTKQKKYQSLPIESMPPLIVENFVVIDGNHRYRALKTLGVRKVLVYEINYE